jgi:hypothetical protein
MAVQSALVQISLTGAPSNAVMTTNITRFTMDLGTVLLGPDTHEVAIADQVRLNPVLASDTAGLEMFWSLRCGNMRIRTAPRSAYCSTMIARSNATDRHCA